MLTDDNILPHAVAMATATDRSPPARERTCPTDFAYWEAKERPAVRRARAASRVLMGADLCPPDDVAEKLCSDLY